MASTYPAAGEVITAGRLLRRNPTSYATPFGSARDHALASLLALNGR